MVAYVVDAQTKNRCQDVSRNHWTYPPFVCSNYFLRCTVSSSWFPQRTKVNSILTIEPWKKVVETLRN